ncbi:MAG: hypothetical protein EA403_08995 [Spirochaetaceae bacterium]|nr:MAG: hypothetical protein EA403_08995 [Spirochaetaceae bacterium]
MTVVLAVGPGAVAVAADEWGNDGWGSDGWEVSEAPAGMDLSGYLETTGLTVLPRNVGGDDVRVGLQTLLRLRGRFEPQEFLSVTVETEFLDRRGAVRSGDESRQIRFDYLYGSAAFGPVDLRVGRQPLAWGTAYAFNPTDLMNPSTMEGLAGVEPPGITAVSASLTLGQRWGIEGYLGFEERSRHASALDDLSRLNRLPYGVRGRAFLGPWDLGIGFARSALYDPGPRSVRTMEYAVAEIAGSIGPVLLYAETAIEAAASDWNPERSVDAAVGGQWEPLDRLSLQAEYHRRGRGTTDVDEYPASERLAGRLVGQNYLVGIGTLFLKDDDLRLMVAALTNLNDYSAAVRPELTWLVTEDFELGFGASLSFGSRGSEFDGRVSDNDLGEVDLGVPRLFAKATWYF